jgi:hypothetical protein
MKTKKQLGVRLDHDLYLALMEIRERVGIPVTESLRRAVRDYVEKNRADSQVVQVQNLPKSDAA